MPNLTSVHVTAGVPDIGTGDVSTIDALMADGGQATLGARADAAWSGSGAGSLVAVAKAMAASLAGTLTVAAHAVTQSGAWSVSLGAALPAGTNAIGKLSANDGVDIGDVTVNNAAGASAVNVQDGGNSLTIDNAALSNINANIDVVLSTRASEATQTSMADGEQVYIGSECRTDV